MYIQNLHQQFHTISYYHTTVKHLIKILIEQIFSFMSSAPKSVPGDLLTYIICIHIHTLGYKIKSLTLLKRINFTKQTRVKLAGNAVPARHLDISILDSNKIPDSSNLYYQVFLRAFPVRVFCSLRYYRAYSIVDQ